MTNRKAAAKSRQPFSLHCDFHAENNRLPYLLAGVHSPAGSRARPWVPSLPANTRAIDPFFPEKTAGQEKFMRIRYWSIVAIVMLAAVSTALAESPWAGKWKMDPSQSKLTGDTIHFAPARVAR